MTLDHVSGAAAVLAALERIPMAADPQGRPPRLFEAVGAYERELLAANAPSTAAALLTDLLEDLRRAQRSLVECLQALGSDPVGHADPSVQVQPGPGVTAADDPGAEPVDSARALAGLLAMAEKRSEALARRLQGPSGPAGADHVDAVVAAARCRALIGDALLIGAVELAVLLGAPEETLPS